MAAAVASAFTPASTMVSGSPSIDARLNLSLDDLIKERRKETKKEVLQQKKRQSVKQEQASPVKKAEAQQQKKKATANAQSEQRKDKMNKNRGLPAVQPQTQKKKQSNNSHSASANVPSKAAKKLLRKKAKKAAAAAGGRNTPSPKSKQQPVQQQKFKNQNGYTKRNGNNSPSQKNTKQQSFKQFKPMPPTLSPKQQSKKTMTFTVKPAKGMRAVNKTAKGSKLQITLVRSDADVRRTKKQKQFEAQRQTVTVPAKKKLNAKAAKALLPGKAQPKTRKVLAQTLVKQAKRSVSARKQWTSQNGKFIVRKPVMVRRA